MTSEPHPFIEPKLSVASRSETRRWVLNVWGDHIPCRTQDELEREIHDALNEGATEMSIERKDEK